MVGEWPVITLGVLLTLIRNPKAGFIAGLCFLLEAALVNGTKMLIHTERPVMAVGLEQLHQVAGETIHRYRSFPSGHTTASVIGFGLLSLLYPRKGYEVIFAISAVLIGYSRLYLGQHYLHDVLSGAIIGLLILQLYILLTRKFLPGYLT